MDRSGFSFPSEQQRREIRSVCKEIFNGRNATEIFKAYPLNFLQWLIVAGLSIIPLFVVEIEKRFSRSK